MPDGASGGDAKHASSSFVYCPPPPLPTTFESVSSANPETEDIFGDREAGFTAADAEFFNHDPCGSAPTSLLLTDETYAAIDTFDEVNSTISTCSLSSGTNFNGSNDKPSNSSSPSSSTHLSTTAKNSINYERTNLNSSVSPVSSLSSTRHEVVLQKSMSMDSDSPTTDVKRVRAIFENSCNNTCSEPETNSSSSPSSSWKKSPTPKKACSLLSSTSKTSLLSVDDRSGSDLNLSTSSRRSSITSSPLIRSAYSQLQLNQMEKYEFVDLLVNDNIIIEDSPDLFQKQRSRFQDMDRVKGSQPTGHSTPDASNRHSSLRRTKSVGGGLHKRDSYDAETDSSSNEDMRKSRPCILAEELPAPDTVKNVRNVFEKLLHKKVLSPDPTVVITPLQHKSNVYTNSIENLSKKSLSSVKSNPTSKILRSESMRDDSVKCSRYGKPILLNAHSPPLPTPTSTPKPKELASKAKKAEALRNGVHKSLVNGTGRKSVESATDVKRETSNRQCQRRAFEIGKRADTFPTFGQQRRDSQPEQDSLLSMGSSLGTIAGDDEEPRMISPDVLNKIRSCGTTTTYFGGEIVAKTVRNRNLILPPPKSESSERDEVDFVIAPSSEVFFTTRSNQPDKPASKSDTPARQNNHANRNGSGIDFTSFRFMEFESPSSRLSRPPDDEDIPRIISVEPKSQPNSPTKSNSPTVTMMGSIIVEGRNSPEGCESNASASSSFGTAERTRTEGWINNHGNGTEDASSGQQQIRKKGDGNNNCIKPLVSAETNGQNEDENKASDKKFSEAAEGAWF